MARLGHPGPDPQPVAVVGADQLDLIGVKAEVVQPAQPFGDAVPLVLRVDDDVLGEGGPQPLVPLGDLLGQVERLDVGWQLLGGGQVEQFPSDPFECELDVVLPLAVAEGWVQFARLGVHEDGLQGAGVQPEKRVRQRAVTPEEPGKMEPHEELDEGVEEPVGRAGPVGVRVERPVRRRVLEEVGAQDGVQLRALVDVAVDDDPERLDRRDAHLVQAAQEPVLPAGEALL